MSCAGRSEFFVRAEPERSEGGLSEEMKNREGVASGSATRVLEFEVVGYEKQRYYCWCRCCTYSFWHCCI